MRRSGNVIWAFVLAGAVIGGVIVGIVKFMTAGHRGDPCYGTRDWRTCEAEYGKTAPSGHD